MWLGHECGAIWRNRGERRTMPYPGISQLLSFREWWVYFPGSSTRTPAIAQGCPKSQIFHSHHRMGVDPPVAADWFLNPWSPGVNIVSRCNSHLTGLSRCRALAPWLRVSTDSFLLADFWSLPSQGHLVLLPLLACQGNSSVLLCSGGLEESLFLP